MSRPVVALVSVGGTAPGRGGTWGITLGDSTVAGRLRARPVSPSGNKWSLDAPAVLRPFRGQGVGTAALEVLAHEEPDMAALGGIALRGSHGFWARVPGCTVGGGVLALEPGILRGLGDA